MRKATKLMLAFAAFGSLVLASCKDYSEDDFTNAVIDNSKAIKTLGDAVNQQIVDLTTKVDGLKTAQQQFQNNIGGTILDSINNVIARKDYDNRIQTLENAVSNLNSCTCDKELLATYITNFGLLQDSVKTLYKNMYGEDGKVGIKDSVGILNTQVGALSANATYMSERINAQKDSLNSLYEEVKALDVYSKTQVDDLLKNLVKADALSDSIAKVRTDCQSLLNKALDEVNVKIDGKADKVYVDSINTDLKAADKKLQKQIDSLALQMDTVKVRLDSLESKVSKLEDARLKQVTGITVQQVYTPAYGSYNSLLTNTQTTLLVGYYGTASKEVIFPKNVNDPAIEKIEIQKGMSLIAEGDDNAGRIYLTIDPREVDFNGIKEGFALVNSLGKESALKLGVVKASSKELVNGYTRGGGESVSKGFYEIPVSLTEDAVKNPELHLNIDKSAIKTALSDLVKSKTKADGKMALKEIATVAMKTINDMKLPALGMECAWNDAYGEHSVVSAYNMSGVAVQPLGFESLDGFFAENGKYWDVYARAKNLSSSVAKTLGTKIANAIKNSANLDGIKGTISDLQDKIKALHFEKLEYDGKQVLISTTVKVPSMTVTVPPVKKTIEIEIPKQTVPGTKISKEIEITYQKPTTYNTETEEFEFEDATIKKTIEFEVEEKEIEIGTIKKEIEIAIDPIQTPETKVDVNLDITKDIEKIFNSMVGQINPQFESINQLVEALNSSMDQINTIFDSINKLEDKLASGSYINGIYKYTDKLAQSIANIAPRLMKPVLMVNSDAGFGLCGHEGAPSTVKGNVRVLPTTWTAELLTPVYAKYVRVNDNAGHLITNAQPGTSIDITSELKEGVNTITYSALDYTGVEYTSTYKIVK